MNANERNEKLKDVICIHAWAVRFSIFLNGEDWFDAIEEYGYSNIDYDNCASHKPITFEVKAEGKEK